MEKKDWIKRADEVLLHTYNRAPVLWDHGEGVYLFDTEGRRYLDFAAGIAVCALGYGNEALNSALKSQIDDIIHTSNLFYNRPITEAAERLCAASGMDRAFFTNSGAEAIEGAVKAAKKYAYMRDGFGGHEIIAMDNSFHGRTLGALSVTGHEAYRKPFDPLMPGVVFADFNDLKSVKAKVNEKTCAVLLETVQGEGGIYPADPAFLRGVEALCKEGDILLILDEIQCGMGRTGEMFAYQHYGVHPDIVTSAKALGCGFPVGAFLLTQRVADQSLLPGDHGSTYGGSPLAGAAVCAVLDQFRELDLLLHVKEISSYLTKRLDELIERTDCLTLRRGMGLMQGLVCQKPLGAVTKEALREGLVVISAGTDVIRLLPPLIIKREHVDEMIERLSAALSHA